MERLLVTGDERLEAGAGEGGPARTAELLTALRAEFIARHRRPPSFLDEVIAIVTQLGP
jgi:hypothetical protein